MPYTPPLDPSHFTRHHDFGTVARADRQPSDLDRPLAFTRRGAAMSWLAILAAVAVMAVGMHVLMESLSAVFANVNLLNSVGIVSAFAGGLLATLMLQSSTLVSVLLVTAVGSGAIPVESALAAIFAANLATTATPLLFSMFFAGDSYRQATRVAATHFWFNVFGVAMLWPIEMLFHPLRTVAIELTEPLPDLESYPQRSPWDLFSGLAQEGVAVALFSAFIGLALVGVGMHLVRWRVRHLIAGTGFSILERSGGLNDAIGIMVGALGTMAAGASSIVVSGVAAASTARHGEIKGISLRSSLPVILGANIGTTLTGILAALSVSGPFGVIALQVALVHLLFNLTGTLLVLLFVPLRKLIGKMASRTAALFPRSILLAIMAIVFVAIPTGLLLI